jgi:YD repeat-containing protein
MHENFCTKENLAGMPRTAVSWLRVPVLLSIAVSTCGLLPTSARFADEQGSLSRASEAQSAAETVDSGTVGDPVITLTGLYTYTHTDLTVAGASPSTHFARSYNSLDTRLTPLGPGWTHSYNIRVDFPGDPAAPDDVFLVQADARSDRYTFNSRTKTYTRPVGLDTTLSIDDDGGFTARNADKSIWKFDSVGQLTTLTDASGTSSEVTYGSNGEVASVTDAAHRGSLTFTYDRCLAGRLCSIADWLNPPRTVQFGYDSGGRLQRSTDRNGNATTYTYDGASERMSTLTDANGHVALTLGYDASGRVVKQQDARGLTTGQLTTFTYSTHPDGTKTTTSTYPPAGFNPDWSSSITDTYDALGRLVLRQIQGSPDDAPLVIERTYNDDWRVLACTVRGAATPVPSGNPIDAGSVTAPTEARPGTCPLTPPSEVPARSSTQLGPQSLLAAANERPDSLLTRLSAASREATKVVQDPVGRPTNWMVKDGTTWSVDYDLEDRPRFVHEPNPSPGGGALVTELRYDAVGNLIEALNPDGQTASFGYDERNSLVDVSLPSGLTAQYTYDDRGDLASETFQLGDGSGDHHVDYAFDALDRLRRITNYPAWPDSSTTLLTEFAYDDQGNVSAFASQP